MREQRNIDAKLRKLVERPAPRHVPLAYIGKTVEGESRMAALTFDILIIGDFPALSNTQNEPVWVDRESINSIAGPLLGNASLHGTDVTRPPLRNLRWIVENVETGQMQRIAVAHVPQTEFISAASTAHDRKNIRLVERKFRPARHRLLD